MIKHFNYIDFFPYAVFRKDQEEIIDRIEKSARQGNNILLVAPNGTGKTIMVLSGLLPLAQDKGLKIVYLCRTHAQSSRVIHAQKEEYELALEYLNKALEVLPNAWFSLLVKGQVLISLDRPKEVLPITENLLSRQVAVLEALHLRAVALIEMDDPEMGLTLYNKVLELKPDYLPVIRAKKHLLENHMNNIAHVMNYIREPARKAYRFLHDLLSKVESYEFISMEFRDLMLEGAPLIKELEIEFEQPQFKDHLPKIIHELLLNKGYFLIHVGKINAKNKRLLLFGTLLGLYPRDHLVTFQAVENEDAIPPYHELIWNRFEELEKQWKKI